jgi:hypothetical protein
MAVKPGSSDATPEFDVFAICASFAFSMAKDFPPYSSTRDFKSRFSEAIGTSRGMAPTNMRTWPDVEMHLAPSYPLGKNAVAVEHSRHSSSTVDGGEVAPRLLAFEIRCTAL